MHAHESSRFEGHPKKELVNICLRRGHYIMVKSKSEYFSAVPKLEQIHDLHVLSLLRLRSYYTMRKSGKDQTFRTIRHMHHVCAIHIRLNSVHGHLKLLVV